MKVGFFLELKLLEMKILYVLYHDNQTYNLILFVDLFNRVT